MKKFGGNFMKLYFYTNKILNLNKMLILFFYQNNNSSLSNKI